MSSSAAQSRDLMAHVDRTRWTCINERAPEHVLADTFIGDTERFLESDTDAELIISLPFISPVTINSIEIMSRRVADGPKDIRIFVDKGHIDFEDVHDVKPDCVVSLTKEQVTRGSPIPLDPFIFSRVRTLTIFVENNQSGSDTTMITSLNLNGAVIPFTNMRNLRRVG
eukprot:EC814861.1.p1 GENE.EC814861.1~~EC814861.1.p1  ORF type:complete len:169 (+),score=78.07 EC814861.1:12-518(+)